MRYLYASSMRLLVLRAGSIERRLISLPHACLAVSVALPLYWVRCTYVPGSEKDLLQLLCLGSLKLKT